MDIKAQIKTLLKEAELYRSHGLLDEAKGKYSHAAELIQKNEQLPNRQSLLDAISKKIGTVGNDIRKVKKAPTTPELSPKVQDLIKKVFSFSEEMDEDAAELEGAIALAKFGQFQRALIEFNGLIKKDSLRVVAAKNVLRCHMALSSLDDAVTQYEQWLSGDIFSSGELENIRIFLQDVLNRKGIDKSLATVTEPIDDKEDGIQEEEFLDVSLIGITLDRGPHQGKHIELEVNFQRGDMLSLIIPSRDRELIENLDIGCQLSGVKFYSPIAIFRGSGIVLEKTQISVGPREGDYRLDIRVKSA
jgi:tetratricopeptide (TPR) repeat protein